MEYAVIVAGGTGTRMTSDVPKQYIPVNGLPILMHTIRIFFDYSTNINLIAVLAEKDHDHWQELCHQYKFHYPVILAKGGETRFQSVRNGLEKTGDSGLVAIHDGVRPMVDKAIIGASFQLAALHGCAIAAVRLKESIRITDKDETRTVDRSKYRLIQTPQTFQIPIIKRAYEQPENPSFTDDASVAEKAGYKISLFEGSYRNIKITTPEDLQMAAMLLRS
ncbi:MAG: 2-C-methyl-D-erythritol 4-phosphate cytidylyltransferase [Cyclobacteriaceae bacterium]|nr:2-C-methyl-D-erythritol 4-phosphate cytidylyltransferase [Cyclobacteriaceae bacterium]